MIRSDTLETMVEAGQLRSYALERHDDTGSDPYMLLRLEFPNGATLVITPGTEALDGTRLLDIYRK